MPASITPEQVRHVAQLARLKLGSEEVARLATDLSRVLDLVSKLNELDVENIEPMAHAMDVTNVLRDDEPAAPLSVEAVLANAPEADPPYFKVPKVLGEGSGA